MSSFAYWLPQSRTSNARTRKSRLKLPNARPFPQLQVFQRRPDQGEKMAGENIGLLGRSGPALYPKGSYLGQPLSCSSLMVKKEITRLSCHQIGNRHVSGLEGLYQWARGDRVQQLAHFFFKKTHFIGPRRPGPLWKWACNWPIMSRSCFLSIIEVDGGCENGGRRVDLGSREQLNRVSCPYSSSSAKMMKWSNRPKSIETALSSHFLQKNIYFSSQACKMGKKTRTFKSFLIY